MRMKHFLHRWIPAVLLLAFLSGNAMAQTRIATVDLRKLFDGYWKTKQAENALKDRAADFTKEGTNLQEDYKKGNEEYRKLLSDANDQAVSADERGKRKQAAETKLKELKQAEETLAQFERQARSSIEEQKRRMRDNILNEIRAVVNGRAKSAGYALVLDTAADSATGTPVVVFNSGGENDITDAVLSQLNAGAPVETKKTADDKGEKPKDEKPKK